MDRSLLVALQTGFLGPETLPLLLVIAGLGLSVAEALAPGAHFVVLGVALLLAGLVGLFVGPLASPLALGVMVIVFGAAALYGYREFDLYGKEAGRTSDSSSLKGSIGRVTERVTPTEGEVKLESGGLNPHYAARSMDGEIPVGTTVMVIDPGGGNIVTVDPLDPVEDEIDRELAKGRERERETPVGADDETTDEHEVDREREFERE